MLWTLWILVQTGHITPHAANTVNAVNISVQGGGDTLNTANAANAANAVNFSANYR